MSSRDQLIATVAEALVAWYETTSMKFDTDKMARVAVEALNLMEEVVEVRDTITLHRWATRWQVLPVPDMSRLPLVPWVTFPKQEPPGGEPEGSQA